MMQLVIQFDPSTGNVSVAGDAAGNGILACGMMEMAKHALFQQFRQASPAGIVLAPPSALPPLPNGKPQ